MAKVDVKCPKCGGIKVHRNGKCRTGEQRYICNTSECSLKTFRLEYRYKGAEHGIDEKIIAMAANASGIRDTARVLEVSNDKVMSTLKKRNMRIP
jgi:transposase-like protein